MYKFLCLLKVHLIYITVSGVTDGEEAGGKCPPWKLSCGPLSRNGPP